MRDRYVGGQEREGGPMRTIGVRFPPTEAERLEQAAKAQKISTSELVRRSVEAQRSLEESGRRLEILPGLIVDAPEGAERDQLRAEILALREQREFLQLELAELVRRQDELRVAELEAAVDAARDTLQQLAVGKLQPLMRQRDDLARRIRVVMNHGRSDDTPADLPRLKGELGEVEGRVPFLATDVAHARSAATRAEQALEEFRAAMPSRIVRGGNGHLPASELAFSQAPAKVHETKA